MHKQMTLSARAWSELVLLGVIWGGVFLTNRILLDSVPVLTLVLHRTFWAALALWAVVLAMRLPLPRDPRLWWAFLVMGVLNNVLPFSLQVWAQQHIESGLTAILNASTAVFGVLVAAAVFADERLTPRRIVGVALGFLGVATAIGLDRLTQFDLRSGGQAAVLASTLCYAFAAAWARRRLGQLSPQVAAAGMLTGSALVLFVAALIAGAPMAIDASPGTLGAMAYLSLLATAGAYLLYYRVLALAGSGNLMLVTLIVPPIAIVLGTAVRGEVLGPNAYAGFALLALGLAILNGRLSWRRLRRPGTAAPPSGDAAPHPD